MMLFLLMACGGDKKSAAESSSVDPAASTSANTPAETSSDEERPSNRRGQLIYKQYCVICHGADGKLGVSGAKDLSISTLSKEERIAQVTNGKGLMTPYKEILSAQQIELVVEYLEELR